MTTKPPCPRRRRSEFEILVSGTSTKVIERFFQVTGRVLIVLQALSRIQESCVYSSNVTPTSINTSQPAALSSRIAAGTLVSRLLLRNNPYSDVSCPNSAGKLVSLLPAMIKYLSDVSCPISAGKLVS